jgi:hypothetical protein
MYDIKELYDDFYNITESSVLYTEANEDLNKQRRAKIVLAIAVLTSTIIAIGLIIRKIKKSMVKNAEEETKKLEAVKEEAKNIQKKLKEYEKKIKKDKKKDDGTDDDSAFLTDKEWEDANNLCNKSKELNKKIRSLQEKLGIKLSNDETEKLDKLQDDLLDRWRNEKKKYWKKDEAHFQDALELKKRKAQDEIDDVRSTAKGKKIASKENKKHEAKVRRAAGKFGTQFFGQDGKFSNIFSSGENEEDLMFLSLHPKAYLTEMTDDDINESIHVWMEFFNTIETDIELYNESQYNKYDRISSIILEKADHNKISIEKCAELLDSLEKRYL